MTAVLFDMDGVIVDSENDWKRHKVENILPEVTPDQDVDNSETTGMYYPEIYDYLDEKYQTAVSRERFLDLFDSAGRTIYGQEADLVDGVPELVSELQQRGVTVSLVTSSPHEWIDLVMDRFDLRDDFDTIVSAEDVDRGKPAPDIYERAASEVDADPAECVAIEDSTNGTRAATAAGAFCIGFTGVNDGMDRSIPDIVVDTPERIREIIFRRIGLLDSRTVR